MEPPLSAQEQQLSSWFPTIPQRRLRQALAAGGSLTAALDFLLLDEDEREGAGAAVRAPVVPTIDLTDDAPLHRAREEEPAVLVEIDPLHYLSELFPDAAIEYLQELVNKHPARRRYPKRSDQPPAPGKNKRKAEGDGDSKRDNKRARGDYTTIQSEAMPAAYQERAYKQLRNDFPTVPAKHIISAMAARNKQYCPSFLHLNQLLAGSDPLPFQLLKAPREPIRITGSDPYFDQEAAVALSLKNAQQLECGCCFCEYDLPSMTQCEDGHLFCRECARKAAENQIGLRRPEIKCLSSDGCEFSFSRSAIESFLSPAVYNGYFRLCQDVELEKAGLDDLHRCPFCDFAAVLDTDPARDPLFFCQDSNCKTVTCRLCRRRNHTPLTCEELVQREAEETKRHGVEEAMTTAMVRQCPKCQRNFIKEDGCNKMMCSCGTIAMFAAKLSKDTIISELLPVADSRDQRAAVHCGMIPALVTSLRLRRRLKLQARQARQEA
ncbi:hypothetical protein HDU88_004698 [Geranomyces variabilis]|nr:hypothetical protein HDU88_004698 [Geranomyces variabilis]